MSEQNKNELSIAAEKVLQELQKNGDFEIKPCDIKNIEDNPKYKKLSMMNFMTIKGQSKTM